MGEKNTVTEKDWTALFHVFFHCLRHMCSEHLEGRLHLHKCLSRNVSRAWSRLHPRLESPPGSFFLKNLTHQGRQWQLLITCNRLSAPLRTKNGWQPRKSSPHSGLCQSQQMMQEVFHQHLKGEERVFSEATSSMRSGFGLIHVSESAESILLHWCFSVHCWT